MDSFELELKQGFLEESAQLLTDVEQCFLSLEANPDDASILEKIFRLAHNLKGSSKAVGFDQLGMFTHEFENLLLKLKKGEIPVSTSVVDLLLRCNDFLKETIETLKANVEASVDYTEMQAAVVAVLEGKVEHGSAEPEASSEQDAASETEISAEEIALVNGQSPIAPQAQQTLDVTDLNSEASVTHVVASAADAVTTDAEHVAAATAPTPAMPVSKPSVVADAPKKSENKPAAQPADESIRVSLARLEKLINFVGEMVILQTVLKEQVYCDNPAILRRTVHQLGKVGKEIQDISMSLRMVPLKQTFQKMQRIVRDTSNLLNKKVNLVMTGEETELDKTVLESVSDPLVHLIRNAVDHGIETGADRKAAGKSEAGTVFLKAYHQGGKLVIEVKDDGGGINHEKLIAKAREKGILKPNQTLTKDQGVNLIFHPGFSTKAVVTEVSGRGVGMDVVKTNIEALQGEIQVLTEVGKGTTFKIGLPLTLAIIDAMVVRLDNQRFVIPLSHVHESYRPEKSDVKSISGVGEILLLRGENLPLFRLSQCLGWKKDDKAAEDGIALIVRINESPFAVLVDDIIGQHQVVIKKLGAEMAHMRGFSGSAILGDGKPSLILELVELIKSGNGSMPVRNEFKGRATA